MVALWCRLPVLVRAILVGALVTTLGTVPWALLASLNLRHLRAVPWAVPPTLLYLWLFWRYFGGAGPPRSTAEARRAARRAFSLPDEVWSAAIFAGIVGMMGIVMLQQVTSRLVRLPQQEAPDLTGMPLPTVAAILVTGAVVAGVVEETAFRGYMQGPIERRHGPWVAVLVTGLLFAFAHFTHPETTVALIPYYMAVAAVYGMLAYLTGSILPGVVLHALGDVFVGLGLVARGQSEWQLAGKPATTIWESGADASFWLTAAGLVAIAAVTVWAYAALASIARTAREAA